MRWIRLTALTGIAAVLLLVAGLILFLFTADLGRFKPQIEQIVHELTGRQLVIEGRLEIDFGLETRVLLENARFSNPDWATDPNMIEAKRIMVVLDLWSLVNGPVVLNRIELDGGRLFLETIENRTNNWTFGKPDKSRTRKKNKKRNPIRLVLNEGHSSDFRFVYRNPEWHETLDISVSELNVNKDTTGLLQTKLVGAINERPVKLQGHIGPFGNLLVASDVEINATGTIDTIMIDAGVRIDDLTAPKHAKARLKIKGPDVQHLTRLLGYADFGTGELDLSASLEPVDSGLELDIKGQMGEIALDAEGYMSDLQDLENLRFKANANGPNLANALHFFGIQDFPEEPFKFTTRFSRQGKDLTIDTASLNVGDTAFSLDGTVGSFPNLRGARVNLHIAGNNIETFKTFLKLPDAVSGPFDVTGKLSPDADGKEKIDLSVTNNFGQINVKGSVGEPPDFINTRLEFDARGHNLKSFGAVWAIPNLIPEPFEARGEFEVTPQGYKSQKTISLTVGDNRLEADGLIGLKPLEKDTDLTIRLSGGDISRIAAVAGLTGNIPHSKYAASSRVTSGSDGLYLTDAKVDIGKHKLSAEGLIGKLSDLSELNIKAKVSGPDLAEITAMAGITEDTLAKPYDIAGGFRLGNNYYALDNVTGTLGKLQFKVDGRIGAASNLAGTNLNTSISGPALENFDPGIDGYELPKGPFSISGDIVLTEKQLELQKVSIDVASANALVNAELGWPFDPEDKANVHIKFDAQAKGPDIRAALPEIRDYQPDHSSFDILANGLWHGELITLDQLRIKLDDAELEFSGKLQQPPDWSATEMQLNARIGSLASLGVINDKRLPDRPLALNVHFRGTENQLEADRLEGKIGASDFKGSLKVSIIEDKPDIEVQLDSEYLDLRPLLPQRSVAEDKETDTLTKKQQKEKNKDARLIPDALIPLDVFEKFNLKASLKADQIYYDVFASKNFTLVANIKDGALTVDKLIADTSTGKLDATLSVIPGNGTAQITTMIKGNQVSSTLATDSAEVAAESPKYDAVIQLTGTGKTLHEVAASLNGSAVITGGQGRLPSSRLTILFGDFLNELIGVVNPFSKNETYTTIACTTVILEAEDGVVTSDNGIVIQTDKINIMSNGDIDLSTEKVNFSIRTDARGKIGISAADFINPFIKIGGTMADPRLSVNATSAAVTGGAAIATAGLYLLAKPVWDRAFRSKDPCGKALKDYEKKKEKEKK